MPAADASVGSQSEMWNHWFETRCVSWSRGLQMSAAAFVHGTNTVVQLRHHGRVRSTLEVLDVCKPINRFLWCLQWIIIVSGVWCKVIQYQQHWLFGFTMLGDNFRRGQCEVPDMRIEPPVGRYVMLREESKVPLANHVRSITCLTEIFRHNALIQPETPRFIAVDHVVLHANVDRASARHQGRPRRCAHWCGVVPIEDDTVVREGVNVRGRYLVRAVKPDIVPAHIVRGDDDDVWRFSGLLGVRRQCVVADDAYQQYEPYI
uniref:Uncharacterized protein n=1 Tax=Anopheles culicifacies TaxID=139723 RepID=A0A182M9L2_9DIPT